MEKGPVRPPWLARSILALLLPPEYRDALLGDLAEEFDRRCRERRIVGFARAWYWRQVLHVDVWRLRGEARVERAQRLGGGWGMKDVISVELRQALRVFRRSPEFVAAVVLTLAVGIGGATAIFSLVNGLLLRPIPGVDAPARLAAVRTSEFGGAFGVSSYMDFLDFRERSRSFENMTAFKPRKADASADGTSQPLGVTMVTSSYFDVVGVPAHIGRYFTAEVDQGAGAHPEAVLTEGLWRRWFGSDPSVVGKEIVLNGQAYTVIGVTPPGFRGTSMVDVPDLFVPMTMQPHLMPASGYLLDRRGWGGISIVGRLAEGVSHETAGSEIQAIGRQLALEYPRTNDPRAYSVLGFREAALPGGARGGVLQLSVLLLSVVAALWLVVCLNVANLFLARSMKRRQELAVRRALGASRARITGQLVLEFMAIALTAGVAGMFLARAVAEGVATLPIPLRFDVSLDMRTVAFAGALAIVSGLLCALVPAFAMSGTDPRVAVSTSPSMPSRRRRWPSRILIVSQATLSVILLFATGLFIKTFSNLASADPGFDPENLLTAQFNPSLQGYDTQQMVDFYERLTEAATGMPGVEAVTMADGLPATDNFGRDGWFFQSATDPEKPSTLFFSAVSANFFETLTIPILDGRSFTEGDTPDQPPVVIVNEAGGRLIESRTGRPAVGQRMGMSGPDGPFFEVVGVIGDSRTGRVSQAPPFVYAAHAQILATGFAGQRMVVMLKTAVPPESLAGEFRRVAAAVDPNVSAANIITMDRFLADLLVTERLTVTVLGISSVLALLLVAIGVYGLLAYVVTQRTREFGIRIALGAEAANLRGIVVREALALAFAGMLLGVAGALALARLASSFLVGVTTADPASLGVGMAMVIGVTLAAAYVPARRAMRADPVVAMRVE